MPELPEVEIHAQKSQCSSRSARMLDFAQREHLPAIHIQLRSSSPILITAQSIFSSSVSMTTPGYSIPRTISNPAAPQYWQLASISRATGYLCHPGLLGRSSTSRSGNETVFRTFLEHYLASKTMG